MSSEENKTADPAVPAQVRAGEPRPTGTEKQVDWRELLVCFLLSTTLGIFVCSASDKILNRQDQRPESIEMERAILRGQPFYNSGRMTYIAPWQNRILFPAVLELGIHLGVFTAAGWYVFLRLFFSVAMFATFWLALRMNVQAELKLAGAGLMMLAYCLVSAFSSPFPLNLGLSRRNICGSLYRRFAGA